MDYWPALLMTIAVEMSAAVAVLWIFAPTQLRLHHVVLCLMAINLISHPLAWWAVARLDLDWMTVELLVIVAETLMVRTILITSLSLAALVGVTANVMTLLLGCVIVP